MEEDLPVLYEFEMPEGFTNRNTYWNSLGVCTLRDTLSCTVTETLDGVFELTMTYPDKGWKADEIKIGRVLKVRTRLDATNEESKTMFEPGTVGNWDNCFYIKLGWAYQPFYIDEINYDISGVMEIRAVHYTYRLKEMTLDFFNYYDVDKKLNLQGYLPSDFLDNSTLREYIYDSSRWRYAYPTWYDRNGNVAPQTENVKRANYGMVELYQNINNFLTPPPWMPPDTLIPNYYVRTLEFGKENISNIVLGSDDTSFKNQWKLEIMRDRWCIILTDKRSLKSWDDAYTLKYGRDLVGLKVSTDLSDIITDCFPYYNFSGTNPKSPDGNGTISREVNFRDSKKYVGGHCRLIDYKKDMRSSIAIDMAPWVDHDKMQRILEPYMNSDGSWSGGANAAAHDVFDEAFERFKSRTDICYGKLTADVDFIPLWETQEARKKKALQKLRLSDPVIIEHDRLGKVYSKVTETVYNVLSGSYESIKIESDSVFVG